MARSKKGAPGDQPGAAPAVPESAAPGAGADLPGGESQPKRRRGSRGGRRHKKPAGEAPAAAAPAQTPSSPRDGYAVAPAGPADLPTAPLIPVGPAAAGGHAGRGPGSSAPREAEPEAEAPTKQRGSGSRRAKAAPTAGRPEKTASPETSPAQPAVEDRHTAGMPAETEPATPAGTGSHDGDGEQAPARRRRRGSRGGRRRRKSADIEHEEAAREAEEAAGEPAGGATAEATAERGESPEVAETPRAAAEAAVEPGEAAEVEAGEAPETEAGKRKRRGGRRARGKRAAETAPEGEAGEASAQAIGPSVAEEAEAELEVKEEPGAKAEPKARRQRDRDRRRPKAIVRQDEGSGLGTAAVEAAQRRPTVVAERPERKIILVTDDGEELRVALVEDGRLAEIYIERPDRKSYLGDIYQGKVENVMNGIDAAFVDFGLEKNGFLYVDEVTTPEGEKRARRIADALKNGQQVLVQVIKDPMGHKGARLSTKISLAGRYLVYVPGGSGVGVSRRLKQGERERLRDISKQLKPKDAGLIIRTIAEGHGLEDLKRDLQYLSRLWARLKKKAETVKPPGLVHKEVDISIEVTRDLFNQTCESLIVDDPKRHKAILTFLSKEAPELLPKVHLHTGEEPLFQAYGIEEQINRALERRVPLPSGGNLMIDHAEALTVIDVNTGRFTRGKGLEDTITKTNIEAAKEVVRQLRLRDIGGIIIIDFIDMAHARNRELVLATLEAELETDRTKTYVVELSPLGLVEMTRQNTTDGARGIMTRACPTCQGRARVLSEETMALSVERRVRALARKSQAKAWLIEVNGGVAERLTGARLKLLEKQTGRRVFLEGGSTLPVDSFRVISEGSLAHVEEQRVPVREGQEVTVELEFSLTYSPRDAVGYVDGYMVIVEGGRQHLGKRRRVRITEIARTGARATVLKKDVREADPAD
ncbi:MAG TPA: Rne/Rng family ribonuclease [Thermoleophilia bacterium]|nr:Rne/Rng family ribonuclease [Thermoleophilia bacterium]